VEVSAILIMTNRDREATELLFSASTLTPLLQSPTAIHHRQLECTNRCLRVCSTPAWQLVLLRSCAVPPFQFAELLRAEREAALTALGFSRQTPARTKGKAELYLLCVSVVVVVMGPGCVVCCDVVVLLCEASEAQPEINPRATTVRQETIIFFIRRT
jgi:hypothetical protein